MIWRSPVTLASISLISFAVSAIADPVPVAPAQPAGDEEKKAFSLEMVISPILKNMAVPMARPKIIGIRVPVASPSEKARESVKQGYALVHAQWDFEAYRHFCIALQEDPDCLMAYAGVALALARPHNEYIEFRRAAVDRLLDLLEIDTKREQAGQVARFPALEKEFAAAVATLVSTSPRGAGKMFFQLGQDYPQFLQAQLLAVLLTRDSYDTFGDPSPAQKQAIATARQLLEKHPDNPMAIGIWLSILAEAPLKSIDMEKEILPYARKLVEIDPSLPSWQHMLGHFEFRAGNYRPAIEAFSKSVELYQHWMKEEGVGVNDCDGYIKAKCYLANSYYQIGEIDRALEQANTLRKIKLDPERPRSLGNGMLMWRAYNLPARLYLSRGSAKDIERAIKSLPDKEELKAFAKHPQFPTLAGAYNDAIRVYAGCRKAIVKKDLDAASSMHRDLFLKHIISLAQVAKGATQASDYSHYLQAGNSLAIYDKELLGLIAMNGPEATRVVATGRFLSARDKQLVPSMMMPPYVMRPMDNRLAEAYLQQGKPEDALDAYQRGAERFPKNLESLQGLKATHAVLDKTE
ncbi:tetratricopeptide repeat protein [Verrucomicrobiaceae bacterium N1E253]|uniref:Tetratricopeptide repeat protein n=1 Tax=Oceaniferula marina TaxID=2748318 RepID=A0A851GJL5_9BACT|nr:tetratricopeptide repeat protein [Oceaniferula marina]NWK57713.1 tetratricopeptide repeat protein [Oceaniferula marina]